MTLTFDIDVFSRLCQWLLLGEGEGGMGKVVGLRVEEYSLRYTTRVNSGLGVL